MQIQNLKEAYSFYNKIILILSFLIFIYAFIIIQNNFNIQCDSKKYFGKECHSCGLTRGLNECISFNYKKANEFNIQSVYIYCCLIIQIVLRIFILLKIKSIRKTPRLIIIDTSIFVIMFILIKTIYG